MTAQQLLVSWTMLALLTATARAADPAPAAQPKDAQAPLTYRRIFAPVDRQNEWPFLSQRYLPMDAAEFEDMVGRVNAASQLTAASAAAAIISARYEARLVGDSLVGGQASLEINHQADAPAMLPLEPCSLAVGQSSWADKDGQTARRGQGADGRLEVQVEEAGQLEFDWSLRGRRDPSGVVEFGLEVPPCPVIQWVLDLPQGTAPVCEKGIVTRSEPLPSLARDNPRSSPLSLGDGSKSPPLPPGEALKSVPLSLGDASQSLPLPEGEGRGEGGRRWWIELGGHFRAALRIVRTDEQGSVQQMPRVRQLLLYDFAPQGLELLCRLQIDVLNEPIRQIVLAMAPELRLVSARCGDSPVTWSAVSASADGGSARLVLELPEPIQGIGRELRLSAVAPVKLDQRWLLPTIRPDGLFWQQTSVTLYVPKPLVLEELVPRHARQSRQVGTLPFPRAGESFDLQYFSADAGAEIILGQSESPIQMDSAVAIRLNGGGMIGEVVSRFRVADGDRFELGAAVSPGWTIDAVESQPPGLVADWTRQEDQRKLTVRLSKALSPSRPVVLKVAARRLHSPVGRILRLGDVIPVAFQVPPGGRRLVAIRAEEPYQTRLSGAEGLEPIDPQTLEGSLLELFSAPPRELVFENDSAAANLSVSLSARNPGYSATIRAKATVSGNSLVESYRLHCEPTAAQVDRVAVRFVPPGTTPLDWTLGPGDEARVSAPPSPPKQAASGAPPREETWEIALRPPRSGPFDILAERTSPLNGDQPISLVSLPEAASQRATLVVSSVRSAPLWVDQQRLTAIPAEPGAAEPYGVQHATYRYDPVRDTAADADPPTVSLQSSPETPPRAWIWSGVVESWYEPGGDARHLVTYRVENAGRQRLIVNLPPQGLLGRPRVLVDGASVPGRKADGQPGHRLEVDLPGDRRFVVVSIEFAASGPPLGLVCTLAPPQVEADIPLLSRCWTAWLPPAYRAAGHRTSFEPDWPIHGSGWSQRLFGSLARAVGRAPFDPWNLADWTRLIPGDRARRVQEHAQGVLEEIGKLAADEGSVVEPSQRMWGEVLSHGSLESLLAEMPDDQAPMALLVDRPAVTRIGLTPRTEIRLPRRAAAQGRGDALLDQVGLALLVSERALVLTSTAQTAAYREYLDPQPGGPIWWVRPSALAAQIQQAAQGGRHAMFVPVAAWQEQPADPLWPWPVRQQAGQSPTDALGWSAYPMEIGAQDLPQLVVFHANAVASLGWTVFLAAAAGVFWLCRTRPAAMTVVAGVLGAAAILSPEVYATICSGALLGTISGFGLGLLWRGAGRSRTKANIASPAGKKAVAAAVGLLVAVCGTLVLAAPARGQQASVQTPPAYRVFIPADANGIPTGDKYWVQEGLYDELHRRVADLTGVPQSWMLEAASYRGVLIRQATPDRLTVNELTAAFDLELFGKTARVRLPLPGLQPLLVVGGARLDGRMIEPAWEDGGSTLAFDASGAAGKCRLELILRPPMIVEGSLAGFDLPIPRVAASRLELSVPPDAPKIEVPTALGAVARRGDPPRLAAELGPGSLLSVRWQDVSAADVEELLWLEIESGSVILDARFKYHVNEGLLRQAVLCVDPRLQRQGPFECSGASIAEVESVPAGPGRLQTVRLDLAPPAAGLVVLRARFVMRDTSGVGNLRLPYLKTLESRVTRRWLAVSVEPVLEYDQQAGAGTEAIAVPVFAAAWGDAGEQPLVAYSLTEDPPSWSIVTRPSPPRTAVEQSLLTLSYSDRGVDVAFDARLATLSGHRYQYQLSAPAHLEIESLTVRENNTERVTRWSNSANGDISVFLNTPAEGEHNLSLRGRLPLSVPGEAALPMVRIDGVDGESCEIQVYRQPSAQVTVGDVAGLSEVGTPTVTQNTAGLGRLVKCYQPDDQGAPAGRATVARNTCRVQAEQTTSMEREGDAWRAKVDLRLKVSDGILDEFRLTAPRAWRAEKSDQAVAIREISSPAEPLRRILVRPSAAIEREYRLTISGPLGLAPGDPVSVPQIVLEEAQRGRRLLVLPTQVETQSVTWETEGADRVVLPEDVAIPPVARESFVAYRVNRPSFQAVLRPLVEVSRVHLADIRIAWRADGAYQGVAVFDLEAADLPDCTLRVPAGCRLIQLAVSGVPTTPRFLGQGGWKVPLGGSLLPQRLEVVFDGRLGEGPSRDRRQFDAPSIDVLPVRQTLWTVSGPSSFGRGRPVGFGAVEPEVQQTTRLRSILSLVNTVKETSTEDSEETMRWYRRWARHWADARHEVQRQLALAGRPEQAIAAELQPLDEQQAQAATRLNAADVLSQALAETPVALDAASLWERDFGDRFGTVRAVFSEGRSRFSAAYSGGSASLPAGLGAVGWTALALVLAIGVRQGTASGLFCRWPHVVGVLVGLTWWLWLWPSVLGWLIVLVSLTAAYRSGWPPHRGSSSSVAPVPRSG